MLVWVGEDGDMCRAEMSVQQTDGRLERVNTRRRQYCRPGKPCILRDKIYRIRLANAPSAAGGYQAQGPKLHRCQSERWALLGAVYRCPPPDLECAALEPLRPLISLGFEFEPLAFGDGCVVCFGPGVKHPVQHWGPRTCCGTHRIRRWRRPHPWLGNSFQPSSLRAGVACAVPRHLHSR